ncbi:hypothetical protein PHYBOEH_000374 [Phytophthora boehmeriae]|uniref:RxLR effector protein n=1 Tax=Phytophthora boehmeriae TaxID=109152 RepID=A0A8T1VE08_9STRA|nr:hypothetical protein PHYBOEH_000374 [Phytophthora boehmeriae]
MRAYYILLAAALSVIATGETTPTTAASGVATFTSGQRSLRSYDMTGLNTKDALSDEERGVDLKLLGDLIQPDKIQAALSDAKKQKALFKAWFKDKDMSAAIYSRLSTNGEFIKNKDIVIAYGNYLTRMKNDKILGRWLHTKTLASVKEQTGAQNLNKARKTFAKWYNNGKTADEVAKLVKAEFGEKYSHLLVMYEGFIQKQQRLGIKPGKAR